MTAAARLSRAKNGIQYQAAAANALTRLALYRKTCSTQTYDLLHGERGYRLANAARGWYYC